MILRQVDWLLRHGKNPNEILPEQSVSPMHLAAGLGIRPVCLLLQHGGDPNVRLPDGTTPLHVASMWGDADCVQILLSNGGDPYIRDQDGSSAMDFARHYKQLEVVEVIKKYLFLLTAAEEVTMTPKYTYTRRSVESNTSSNAPSLDVSNTETGDCVNLELYLHEFTRRRRSSVYLNSVQRQIDKYFSEGQKTHVVDVTSPDHLYIEPKYNEKSPSPEVTSPHKTTNEDSLYLHLSSSDSEDSTCTSSTASFVTCDGENLDTIIKMSSLQAPCEDKARLTSQYSPKGLSKQSSINARRNRKYCRRLPLLPSNTQDLFTDQIVNSCEYCGCEVNDGTSDKDTVCVSCERLGLELDELSLKTDMEGNSKNRQCDTGCVRSKPSVKYTNKHFDDNCHGNRNALTKYLNDKETIPDKRKVTHNQQVNSGNYRNQNNGNSADNHGMLDLDQCFIQSIISDDSIISLDESYGGQRIQKAEFHPSDISNITVSDNSQDNAFIQSDSSNSVNSNNATLKSKDTYTKGFAVRSELHKDGSSYKYNQGVDEGSTDGYNSGDNAFIQSGSNSSVGHYNTTLKNKDTNIKLSAKQSDRFKNIENCAPRSDKHLRDRNAAHDVVKDGKETRSSYKSIPKNTNIQRSSIGVGKQTDNERNYYKANVKSATSDIHGGVDDRPTSLSPKVMDDLWSEVRASAMKAKKVRDTRRILDTAFIGRESMVSGVSDASTVDYVYTDKENGIVLLERHLPSLCGSTGSRRSLESLFSLDISPKGVKHSHNTSASSQDTVSYDWKEHAMIRVSTDSGNGDSLPNSQPLSQDLLKLNDNEIRSKLRDYWVDPGPINPSTRQLYLRRLSSLQKDPTAQWLTKKGPDYPPELKLALVGKLDLTDCSEVETKMVEAFQNPNRLRRWREGTLKSSFNYLLLDPRITDNLPNRAANMDDLDIFRTFISAIFYVGKGKRARPYCHLYEAIKQMKKPNDKVSKKVQEIIDIWSGDMGVVSLHCFQSVIPVEAYTREACMVEAIGLGNLTNMKRGDYYGVSTTYSMKQRRKVGVYLLTKALQIFLAEGERQISPLDIKNDA